MRFNWDSRLKRFTMIDTPKVWIFIQFSWNDWLLYRKEKNAWFIFVSLGLLPFIYIQIRTDRTDVK